ncbi:hypothetical protein BGX29_010937 [Mortierella sp. GBA35]|nr:hypothetical protein BGX23_005698 [Mortierella sp. AD031]KAF9105953.1 hypothetical protein BGX29_010937 [Mortierella sp. GBA35]KAG0206563.1 hypothetical protein BGX33_007330 [Mortierella sp. NVP41]
MKFFKSSVAILGAIALIASPAMAQAGYDEEASAARQAEEAIREGGFKGLASFFKAYLTGSLPAHNLFESDHDGVIFNITDANYKSNIFEDEWIIAFCSPLSNPCADYYPTYVDAATTLQNETNTKFAQVWVEENTHIAARFFIPARLPYLVYAKDGQFHQIPYVRNDTQYLVEFIEEEQYKYYPVLDGPMGPYSTLASWMEKYADGMEWLHQYTYWMPKWLVYIIAGSLSGVIFQVFSGGSNYSSDPAKYAHLNPDGTPKKIVAASNESTATTTESKTKKSSSSTKKRSTKKAQ